MTATKKKRRWRAPPLEHSPKNPSRLFRNRPIGRFPLAITRCNAGGNRLREMYAPPKNVAPRELSPPSQEFAYGKTGKNKGICSA